MLEVQIRRGLRRICNACASGVPIIVILKKTQELVNILVNILKNQDSTLNQIFCVWLQISMTESSYKNF